MSGNLKEKETEIEEYKKDMIKHVSGPTESDIKEWNTELKEVEM